MEPIIILGDISITLTELLLVILLMLLTIILTWAIMRRSATNSREVLQKHLDEMRGEQSRLQGRLSQFAEDSERRDAQFSKTLEERLDTVSSRVGKSLEHAQTRNHENLTKLNERLGLIDAAQNNIKALAGEVSGLQSILSNKQARGAFGEKQMQDLIQAFLPARSFSFQHTLSNRTRVDALIHMPEGHGDVAIDAKFPMESWRRLVSAETSFDEDQAARDFRNDMMKHVNDISQKYLIPDETYDLALLFLPSDAIFTEVHTRFDDVVDKGFSKRVVIVSPTTFMATLHTMQAVMNDADIQKNAATIKREVAMMAADVGRLDERVAKLQSHFTTTQKDIDQILTSTRKITTRAAKIDKVEFDSDDESRPPLKLVKDGDG